MYGKTVYWKSPYSSLTVSAATELSSPVTTSVLCFKLRELSRYSESRKVFSVSFHLAVPVAPAELTNISVTFYLLIGHFMAKNIMGRS
jgi:hypothetical protein